jgi:hypothetical protein
MNALTRHFFQDFFRLSFLDDAGEESFRRVILGVLAVFIALGIWLPRILAIKYRSGFANRAQYVQVVMADQLLMIFLPMFIVAFAVALVSHSLFPDETDYRILMALPLRRSTVFAAKLAALLLYASLFVVTTNVAFAVPFSLISMTSWATHDWTVRAAGLAAAGILASTFAIAAVISIQGLVIVLSPRMWLRNMSIATQTVLVCTLVILFPLGLRFAAGFEASRVRGAAMLVPAVWFLGVQEALLGNRDPFYLRVAGWAVAGTALIAMVTAACYVTVYRRFDHVIVRAQSTTRTRAARNKRATRFRGTPEYEAVKAFASATLRRSGLHQLVFLGVAATGLSFATNALLGAERHSDQIRAAQWGPFILIFATVLGLHGALLLPVMRRASWIFRLTEEDARRPRQLAAAENVLMTYGVVAPIVAIVPALLWILGGQSTLASMPVMLAMGVALAEMRLWRWHRIPFTCSYLPGKRPVAHTVLLLVTSFTVFSGIGFGLMGIAVQMQAPPLVPIGGVLALAGLARGLRIETAKNRPLEFEDELPETSYGLGLNS